MQCRWKSPMEMAELIVLRVSRFTLWAPKQGQSQEEGEKKEFKNKSLHAFSPAILVSEAFSYIWLYF